MRSENEMNMYSVLTGLDGFTRKDCRWSRRVGVRLCAHEGDHAGGDVTLWDVL